MCKIMHNGIDNQSHVALACGNAIVYKIVPNTRRRRYCGCVIGDLIIHIFNNFFLYKCSVLLEQIGSIGIFCTVSDLLTGISHTGPWLVHCDSVGWRRRIYSMGRNIKHLGHLTKIIPSRQAVFNS